MTDSVASLGMRRWVLPLLAFSYLADPVAGIAQVDREIMFAGADVSVSLAGTITQPSTGDPIALAVLLSVAGPTDRDLSLGSHKYFKVLADGLAAGGVVTLRFDDRGVGGSGGNVMETSLEERAADACEALKALRRSYPSTDRVGFVGMSEGGGIAAIAQETCGPVSFIVLLSTPVRTGRAVMEGQMRRQLAVGGIPEAQRGSVQEAALQFLELVGGEEPEAHRQEILDLFEGPYGSAILPPYGFVPADPGARTEFVLSPWYQSQVQYDVRDAIRGFSGRVLAVYGELDLAIDPISNADLLRQLAPTAAIHQLPRLNHLMQDARTGSPLEYAGLPSSFSGAATELMLRWLAS